MAAKYSLAVPLATAPTTSASAAAAGGRIAGVARNLDVYLRAVLNFVHTFEHNHVAGVDSRCESDVVALGVLDRDRTQFGGLILGDDIDERSLRAPLNR